MIPKYKKILNLVDNYLELLIRSIQKARKITHIPHRDIENLVKIFFPRTKYMDSKNGFFKHVYIIHSDKKLLVLKEGKRKDIRKDYNTYLNLSEKIRNRYFAKIYWRSKDGRFMLQKYGKKRKVPELDIERLKKIGKRYGLKDVRRANIMFFDGKFKIVDAERIK